MSGKLTDERLPTAHVHIKGPVFIFPNVVTNQFREAGQIAIPLIQKIRRRLPSALKRGRNFVVEGRNICGYSIDLGDNRPHSQIDFAAQRFYATIDKLKAVRQGLRLTQQHLPLWER